MNSTNIKHMPQMNGQNNKYDFDEITALKFPSPYTLSRPTIHTFRPLDSNNEVVSELGSARSYTDEFWTGLITCKSELSTKSYFSFPDLNSIGDSILSGRFTPEITLVENSPDRFSLSLISPNIAMSLNEVAVGMGVGSGGVGVGVGVGGELFGKRDILHQGKFGSMKKRSSLSVK